MTAEAEMGKKSVGARRRIWIRRVVWSLLLLPVFFVILSNVWMQSSWGRKWMAGKITQRLGLDAEVSGAWWIPGGKVNVHGVRVFQPVPLRTSVQEPLLVVDRVEIRPQWGQILKGKRDFFSCEVDSPNFVIPLELLHYLVASRTPQEVTPTAPEIAVAQANPSNDQAKLTETQPPKQPSQEVAAAPAPAPVVADPSKPTSWLIVRNGRCRLVHAGRGVCLFDLRDFEADIPFSGDEAVGRVDFSSLEIVGNQLLGKSEIPLEWKPPVLRNRVVKLPVFGLSYEVQLQVAKVPGIPFGYRINQAPSEWKNSIGVSCDTCFSQHAGGGFLVAPATWSAESIMGAKNFSMSNKFGQVTFSEMQSRIVFTRGILQCADARAIGDEISLLGNGMLLADGRLAGVMRVVASPRTAESIEARFAKLAPGTKPTLPPFVNEDRRGSDILLGGTVERTWISFDQGKNLLDARKVFTLMQQPTSSP